MYKKPSPPANLCEFHPVSFPITTNGVVDYNHLLMFLTIIKIKNLKTPFNEETQR